MIELLFSACLIGSDDCRDVSMLYDGQDISPSTCMMEGQIALARWVGEHPNYRIARFTCHIAGASKAI